MNEEHFICMVCGEAFSSQNLVRGSLVRDSVAKEITKDYPAWSADSLICKADLACGRYVRSLLESEKEEVTALEREVLTSIRDHELLAKNVEDELEDNWTLGEKLADKIAVFGGSWTFLMCFGGFLVLWITVNTVVLVLRPPRPLPIYFVKFDFVMLSCNLL